MDALSIWPALFVIGVILMAAAANGAAAWTARVAWILWAIAACIWYAAGHATTIAPHCTGHLFC